MRIALINEISACAKNEALFLALSGRGYEVINLGMHDASEPELNYCDTSFMTAMIIQLELADLVVSGCGTGQGFCIAANCYPGVVCANLRGPLDAWLYKQINCGNVISVPLNMGYGWAGDVDLKMVFDAYFSAPDSGGYPLHRREPQKQLRQLLQRVSDATHREMLEIIDRIPQEIIEHTSKNAAFMDLIRSAKPCKLKDAFLALAQAE